MGAGKGINKRIQQTSMKKDDKVDVYKHKLMKPLAKTILGLAFLGVTLTPGIANAAGGPGVQVSVPNKISLKTMKKDKSIPVTVTSTADGIAKLSGFVKVKKNRKHYKLRSTATSVSASASSVVKLKIPKSTRRVLTKSLKSKKKVRANVTIVVKDDFGNSTSKRQSVNFTRKNKNKNGSTTQPKLVDYTYYEYYVGPTEGAQTFNLCGAAPKTMTVEVRGSTDAAENSIDYKRAFVPVTFTAPPTKVYADYQDNGSGPIIRTEEINDEESFCQLQNLINNPLQYLPFRNYPRASSAANDSGGIEWTTKAPAGLKYQDVSKITPQSVHFSVGLEGGTY